MPLQKNQNYKIIKIEKGPLQRFKNSNLLMKKFGEVGLQIYRVITGKRSSEELRKDLDIEPEAFAAIINYMEEAGMIELSQLKASVSREEVKIKEEIEAPAAEEEKKEGEIKIETEEEAPSDEEKKEDLIIAPEESEEQEETDETETKKEEVIDLGSIDQSGAEEGKETEEEELNTVEKMIKEKFGDVGIKVYTLIDGSRTTDEIMKETGVSDTKLVEILNFLEDRGIIKMEGRDKEKEAVKEKPSIEGNIGDVMGPDTDVTGQDPKGFPTIDVPVKLGLDIIKSLKLKADILFKFGDRGSRIMENINGKSDVLDIVIKLNLSLYEVLDIINFLLQNGAIIMKPLTRLEIKKKYGDPGFSIYKKYGREGVMLYELIDKNLTIKQMAERITKDKEKFLDIFMFIRKVLNIEIPIDKDVLMKQLG